jgi:hypothetical protein
MCLLAIDCPVSLTTDFAVHFQNRDLTVCPTTPTNMKCTVFKDASGTGTGSFTAVGNASSPATLVLDSFDPTGCYNILCETSDTLASTRIQWNGSFVGGNRTSFGVPYYLSGAASGAGCTKLAPSCEALDITAKSTRAAPAGADLSLYTCAKVKFACKRSCFECPSGLIALNACPADVHDCGCPTGSYLYNGMCKPTGCDDSSDSKDGSKSGEGDSSGSKDCGKGGADSSDSKDESNSKSDGKDGSKVGGDDSSDSKYGSGSKGGGKVDPGTKSGGDSKGSTGTKSEGGKGDYGSKSKGDDSKEGGSWYH